MKHRFLFFSSLLLLLIQGCSRDADLPAAPETMVTEPVQGQSYGFQDTILIIAEIRHQRPISVIEVTVVNEQGVPVLPVQTYYPALGHYKLSAMLVADNRLLESGSYAVRIQSVIDGEVFNKRIRINYVAEPKRLESLLLLEKGQDYRLMEVLPGGAAIERFSFTGDYSGSAVDPVNRMFYAAGRVVNGLTAWDLEKNTSDWTVPVVPSPPLPYITSFYADGKEVFVSTRDAMVMGYTASGLNVFRSVTFANGYFSGMLRYRSWVIAVFEPFSSGFNRLVMFNYPGGTIFREVMFQGQVAGLADFGDDGILLFVNGPSRPSVLQYDLSQNNLISLKEFGQGNFMEIVMPDPENAFFSSGDGVYWYRPRLGSMVKVIPEAGVSGLAYDSLADQLYIASGQTVTWYPVPSFLPAGSISLTNSIAAVHLLYNK